MTRNVHIAVSCAMYARYRQLIEYLPASMSSSLRLNKASLVLGLLSTLGVSIVGNFQVSFTGTRTVIFSAVWNLSVVSVLNCDVNVICNAVRMFEISGQID